MLTWEDIGCGYGEALTVETVDGKTFTGMLVDFEWDFDNDRGEDCISLEMPSSRVCISFYESEIKSMTPAGLDKDV